MWKDKVVGQQSIVATLRGAVKRDSLSHAIMLNGRVGYGGLPLALMLAQDILCVESKEGEACGSCKACHQVDELIHPDLHMAFPVVGIKGKLRKGITSDNFMNQWRSAVKKDCYLSLPQWVEEIKVDKANADINVQECNNIHHRLALASYSGNDRVQIIWMAEQLGSGGNKLLKLIEEPPEGTHIILVSEDKTLVLGTIISRCRTIDLTRIKEEEIVHDLCENHGLDQEKAGQISFLSEGDYARALDFINVPHEELRSSVRDFLTTSFSRDFYKMRSWTATFTKNDIQGQRAILYFYLKLLRELLHYKVIGEVHTRLPEEDLAFIKSQPQFLKLRSSQIESIHHHISDMVDKLNRNVSPRLLMFNTFLKIDSIVYQHEVIRVL